MEVWHFVHVSHLRFYRHSFIYNYNYDSLQTSYDDTENRFILEVGRFRVSLQYNNNAQELVASFAATFGNIQLHLSMPICYNSINIFTKNKIPEFCSEHSRNITDSYNKVYCIVISNLNAISSCFA